MVVCKLCGCTDEQPCITEEGPCSWVMAGLCSACCIILEDGHLIVPKECRNCNLLIEGAPWHGKPVFTCSKGRFDGKLSPPVHQWYVWSGISRPNKGVAAAQKSCPFFEVHQRWIKQ